MSEPRTQAGSRCLLTLVGALFTLCAPTAHAAESVVPAEGEYVVREYHDLRYAEGRDRRTLDVFVPEGAKNPPVVLFVHGGAWMVGDKNCFGFYRAVGRFFARHGAVVVQINYRLSPSVRHPEHVRDVARAFAWTRANAARYGGDADNIILIGHSAGGHLVTLLATDETYLKDPALKLTPADRAALKGVIAVSGVYQIPGPNEVVKLGEGMLNSLLAQTGMNPVGLTPPTWARSSDLLNPLRAAFGDDPEVLKQASPLTHVRKGLPPFLLLYAEIELPLLTDQAKDFAKALKEAGDEVELREMVGSNHNTIMLAVNRPDNPTAEAVLRFLKRHGLRPAPVVQQ